MARKPGTIGYLIPVGVTVGVLLIWAKIAHPHFLPPSAPAATPDPTPQVANAAAPAARPAIAPPSDIISAAPPPPPPPPPANTDESQSGTQATLAQDASAAASAAPAPAAIRRLACTPDLQRSSGDAITEMTFLFDEERQCVNNRTPYVDAGKYYERFIVNSKESTVSLIAVPKNYSAFIRLKYIVPPEQMAAWRNAERTAPQCGDNAVQAAQIAAVLNSVSAARTQLGQPVGVSFWTCTPN